MTSAQFPRLTTKLTPAALAPHLIARTPAGLDGSNGTRVILVRAPAGFGKSTAMMQCFRSMEQRGASVAWLTIDARDNDLTHFVHYLGVMMVQAGIVTTPPHSPLDALSAIAGHPSPFTLFMDDLDALRDTSVLGLLCELIARLPRSGQVIVGSRSWPDLGLGRLRARSQLAEVGPAQLRFSLDESREFLRKRDACLPEHTLASLHARCEGWPAGLSLASLAIARHPHAAALAERFSGSDQALAEYLAEDVLDNLSPEVSDFLVRTSVLKQLTASICSALCPTTDCAAMLEQLAAQGMFLTRIGDTPPSWSYHRLFSSFLLSRLEQRPGNLTRALHLAASRAYESEGRPVPAIDHAVLAPAPQRAVELLELHAETFVEQGRLRLLDRWFQAISAEHLPATSQLRQLALWATCLTRGPLETLAQMGCSDALPAAQHPPAQDFLSLRAMVLALQDRYADAYAVGQQALEQLPTDLPFADSALLNLMANLASIHGNSDESRKLLDLARARHGQSAFNRMYAESLEGMLDLLEGRMRQATARFRIAVETTQHDSFHQSHGNAWAGVLLAYALYEANALDEAAHLLNIYLPMARDVGLPDHMILSHALRTRLAFATGDVDSAVQTLTELEHLGHLRQLPRVVVAARLERSRIFMLQGNERSAREELERACDTSSWEDYQDYRLLAQDLEFPQLAQLRWQACLGDARAAIDQAAPMLRAAEGSGRHRRALKLRLLLAMAQYRDAQEAAALALLAQVLQSACQEGFVRLVLDEAPWVKPLLARYFASASEGSANGSGPVFMEYLHRLCAAAEVSLGAEAEPDAARPPSEPLTRKELHVLQLLAEGYSNSAIAEKLVVADTTVRTHLRHINAKLNARSRTQAVALARKLRLIL